MKRLAIITIIVGWVILGGNDAPVANAQNISGACFTPPGYVISPCFDSNSNTCQGLWPGVNISADSDKKFFANQTCAEVAAQSETGRCAKLSPYACFTGSRGQCETAERRAEGYLFTQGGSCPTNTVGVTPEPDVAEECKPAESLHQCSWSGLTIKCVDQEQVECTTSNGGDPYLKLTGNKVPGIYQIEDFVAQFVRVAQWGLGFVVALAVLMFVWAGWQFVTAGGREHQVDEGKRIITGTVTGLVISFAAFVIINFAVYALTGETAKTQNGGFLGVLFPKDSSLRRIFSGGENQIETRTSCRSANNDAWEKGCSDRVMCADPGTGTGGEVAQLQKRLNELNCSCGGNDGCYGQLTVDCVRRFQLANSLPPSGVMDPTTTATLNLPGLVTAFACDDPRGNADSVMSNLPKAILPFSSTGTGPNRFDDSSNGCCIVNDGVDDLYCLQDVSAKTCESLDGRGGNSFLTGKTCAGSQTNNRCGHCRSNEVYTVGGDNNCFELATPTWCSAYAKDSVGNPLSFRASTCEFRCDGTCRKTIMTKLR